MPVADDPLDTLESEPRGHTQPDPVADVAKARADEAESQTKRPSDLETAALRRRAIERALGDELRQRAQARMDAQRAAEAGVTSPTP